MKTHNKLTNKNFILIAIGQIISLVGNGILRFALPLYLLQVTGSSAIFGTVSAISLFPLIVLIPVGGMIADRANKRNIMMILDFITGVLMFIFYIILERVDTVPLIIITLTILNGISGLYQPAVQASMPLVLDKTILVKGNSIISSINAISNLLSPVIGGLLLGFYGIYPIIIVSSVCFFVSVIFEWFIKIQHNRPKENLNVFRIAKADMKISANFIFKEKPIMAKIGLLVCVLNAFVSSLIIIAMPIMVTKNLDLSEEVYGFSQGVLAFGGLCGGILTGILNKKLKIEKIYKGFLFLGIALVPFGISPLIYEFKMLSFSLILSSAFIVMNIAIILSIQIMTYVQSQTPESMLGKVTALLLALSVSSQPVGQVIYGYAFEYLVGFESYIIFMVIIVTFASGAYAKKILRVNTK